MSFRLRYVSSPSLYGILSSPRRFITPHNIIIHNAKASRLARKADRHKEALEPEVIPSDAPRTAASWEKPPAAVPSKGNWKTAVLLLYIGGPVVSNPYFF